MAAPTALTTRAEVPVTVVALDGRVDLDRLSAHVGWPEIERSPILRVYERPDASHVYVFALGAIVQEDRPALDLACAETIAGVVGRRVLPNTAEVMRVEIDPLRSAERPRVGWNHVVIQERSARFMGAVALLLAQSAALERYEKRANELLDEALTLTRHVQVAGRLPTSTKALTRRVARITGDRLEMVRHFFVLDRPDATWVDARIDRLYDALSANLELERRHAAVLLKLEHVESTVEALLDLWQARRGLALELAIVLLIILEVVLALAGIL